MNNDGAGATQRRGGIWDCAINRAAGYAKTMSAMSNKTRSRHRGTSQNNLWKPDSSGLGGNVKGYGSHGGSHSY